MDRLTDQIRRFLRKFKFLGRYSWMVEVPGKMELSEDKKTITTYYRVRRWHPGYWLAMYQLRAEIKKQAQ